MCDIDSNKPYYIGNDADTAKQIYTARQALVAMSNARPVYLRKVHCAGNMLYTVTHGTRAKDIKDGV